MKLDKLSSKYLRWLCLLVAGGVAELFGGYYLEASRPTDRQDHAGVFGIGNDLLRQPSASNELVETAVWLESTDFRLGDSGQLVVESLVWPGRSAEIYPGQQFSLIVRVWFPVSSEILIEQPPSLTLENAVVVDLSALDASADHSFHVTEERREIEGVEHRVITFATKLYGLSPGRLSGYGELFLSWIENGAGRDYLHPLFAERTGGWLRGCTRVRGEGKRFRLPELTVAALPMAPGEGWFLGLVGAWRVSTSLSRENIQVGEMLVLTVEAEGRGSTRFFKVPELDLPGFIIHGVEMTERRLDARTGFVRAAWVLTPRDSSARLPDLRWLTFAVDPAVYVEHDFTPRLVVQPAASVHDRFQPGSGEPDWRSLHELAEFQFVRDPGEGMKLPWWRHRLGLTALLLATGLGGVIGGAAVGFRRRRRVLLGEAGLRQRRVWKHRSILARRLEKCRQGELPLLLKQELVPWLIAVLQMPPGSTADELAEALREVDSELASMVAVIDHLEYDASLSDRLEPKKLGLRLRNWPFIWLAGLFILFYPAFADSADPVREKSQEESVYSDRQADLARAAEAYGEGDYERAYRLLVELEDPARLNPWLLHNRALCQWRLGSGWRALALYERARLAAPREPLIRDQLARLRSQLGLSPTVEVDLRQGRIAGLRDQWRPDQWLLVAASGVAAAGLLVLLWFLTYRPVWLVGMVCSLLITVIAILALFLQLNTIYRPGSRGIVVVETHLFAAPSVAAMASELSQPAMREVEIIEFRGDWLRVAGAGRKGWLRRETVELIY